MSVYAKQRHTRTKDTVTFDKGFLHHLLVCPVGELLRSFVPVLRRNGFVLLRRQFRSEMLRVDVSKRSFVPYKEMIRQVGVGPAVVIGRVCDNCVKSILRPRRFQSCTTCHDTGLTRHDEFIECRGNIANGAWPTSRGIDNGVGFGEIHNHWHSSRIKCVLNEFGLPGTERSAIVCQPAKRHAEAGCHGCSNISIPHHVDQLSMGFPDLPGETCHRKKLAR